MDVLLSLQASGVERENDDDDDSHSNISASEDEGDLEDESRHSKLLEAIGSMETKKRSKVKQRSEASADVSEYQLNTKDVQGKGIWIHDLMGSLKNTPSHSALKKQMNNVNKRKTLPTPLHQHEAEKIQRTMAYEGVSKEVSKWDQVVQTNRKAEHLSFPLNQKVVGLPTTDQFVKKFKPSTPLEQEVYKILHGSKFAERPNKQLSQAEEEAIKAMSLSEARERRAELQKHRALMSFYEAKCRRHKKIKSKKYHRIERKSKARQESKKMEKLMEDDPEAAKEAMEKLEKARATERMSLKHRNTGKWAKTMMRYGKHNISARQELAEQLQKSHELTEKIAEVNEDKTEETNEVEEEEEDTVQPSLSDINNPWFTGKVVSKGGDKAEEGEREVEQFVALEEVQAKRDDDDGSDEEESGADDEEDEIEKDHKMLKMIQEERRKWENDADDDDEEDDEEEGDKKVTQADEVEVVKKGKKSKGVAKQERTKSRKADKKGKQKKVKVIEVDVEEEDDKEEDDDAEESQLEEGVDRRQTHSSLDDQDWLHRLEEQKKQLPQKSSDDVVQGDNSVGKEEDTKKSTGIVDPSKVFVVKPKDMLKSAMPVLVEQGDDDDGGMDHRMNIMQAFEDDDVVEEFKEDKKAKVEKDKPKDIDLTLPGWGDWGGTGVETSKKKRKRFIIKAKPQAPRQDAQLAHVIINEDRDKKIAIHQVNSLPFPFTSTEQFERSIRAPVGSTWNTPSAVKALTTPKVSTKIGTIIRPIKAEEAFKEKNRKRKNMEEMRKKRKGQRPDIVFDEGSEKKRRKGKGKG
nr:U3 small nucleolar RNA-associated protein 14 homolog A-like [Lytechinus pictus]